MEIKEASRGAATGANAQAVRPAAAEVNLSRIAPTRDERLFLVLSIFIGVISGLLVVSFRVAIEWIGILTLGSAPHPGQLRLLFVPAAAGLLVAALVIWFFPGARGSGVNQTKAALYIYNGYISFRTVIGKFITSAIAIGAGHSLGPEDPSLQIGAGVASMIARRLRLSRQRLRMFAPIGAAAGLAAAFNAPISAILFVIEEVIGNWSAAVLGSVVLAAISSVVVARWFWGAEPMFRIPSVSLRNPQELIAYAVLGIAGGLLAPIFSRALGFLRPRLRAMPPWTRYGQPALAGLLVGAIGYFGFPQVMGSGYGVIDQAMHGQYVWQFLVALTLLKLLATTLSFSSGTPGGMFAPTLFIGAMLGAAVGTFEKHFFPHLTGTIGAYSLVGMGVLFAGFLRAPLTSVFMVLEVSGNYSIILPVILANTIAYLLSRSLQPVPIFETFTHQDGLELPSMEEQREELVLHLEDALRPVEVPVASGSDSIEAASRLVAGSRASAFLVQLADGTWYAMTAEELTAAAAAHSPSAALVTALRPDRTPMLFPDLPLESALHHFPRWPLLPVLNRANRSVLEGVVALDDILRRYRTP
ncbi:chloride channel protein [Paracidobacterium acidisoli]|uniref:Chloride channel protein n=1 Tax=Paracidobacterium acidisoli TaxID=2303751 RepID=A0A372IUE2_9BACT|nr:chloride channel protein [Paracidobacterium acidisoli]MBT9329990.1 chloride channel protein [Paracidobacterium acidisoli]